MKVIIPDHTNTSFRSLMDSLSDFFPKVEKARSVPDETIQFDMSAVRFTSPLYLALMRLLLDGNPKRYSVSGTTSYLQAIAFPQGMPLDSFNDNAHEALAAVLPFVRISREKNTPDQAGQTISSLAGLLAKTANIENNILSGVNYVLQEILDNFWQHSKAKDCYISCQYYPNNSLVDVVVADNGVGLKGSYDNAGIDVKDDLDAMNLMVSACSSKNNPESLGRGFGIATSRKMAVTGLDGEFLAISGSAAYAERTEKAAYFSFENLNIGGTAIAFRFKKGKPSFNIYKYLES